MKWAFPSNNGGEIKGLSDAGIETFRADPLRFLAREICQNSLDAALGSKTVKVEFVPFFVDHQDFPGIDSLLEAFEDALNYWDVPGHDRTVGFFKSAINELKKRRISFLRISDFNTKGLSGSEGEFNTPWLNLTKSSGVSDKSGAAGGSFGIGKYAPFACSAIQTVFYGTVDEKSKVAFQGVSRITSFKKRNSNDITTNVGYWGDKDNTPIKAYPKLDSSFGRHLDNFGTDVFVAGFRNIDQPDWKESMIGSIIDGFLVAIMDKKLSVLIEDIRIDHLTLPDVLQNFAHFSREHAANYYEVLTSDETSWFPYENFHNLGRLRLGLMIKPEMHRKVAMVRKTGMKILDRGGISAIIPFAGVLLIEGDGINEYLRKIENPSHTKWEPQRMEPSSKINQAWSYIRDMNSFIREKLEQLKASDPSEEIDADVGEFLPDDGPEEKNSNLASKEDLSSKKIEITKLPPRPKRRLGGKTEGEGNGAIPDSEGSIEEEANISGAGHDDGKSPAGGYGGGLGEGEGEGINPNLEKLNLKPVLLSNERSICLDREGGRYAITFIPTVTTSEGQIELFLSAETDRYKAPLLGVTVMNQPDVSYQDNRIFGIQFLAGKAVRAQVLINCFDYIALEVRAYGNT